MVDTRVLHLPCQEVEQTLTEILERHGFMLERARTLAQTFTNNSLDGVATHGLNRFARFVAAVKNGRVAVGEQATLKNSVGSIEQWDGRLAAGILNALQATDRTMEIARDTGIGCVALANTNHWMRGGTYGWRAAKQGFVFIGWTNTIANMPAWGARDSRLGNNPLVLAVPYQNEAIVLDMAQSQFSYGAIEAAHLRREQLPFPGGYDAAGQLTKDPSAILQSERALPAGYWKGAGLSLLLDILATILSGGRSTVDITRLGDEYGVSQVFMAIDTKKLGDAPTLQKMISNIIEDYHQSEPTAPDVSVRYPGEGSLHHRHINRYEGVPVNPYIWAEIQAL